MNFETRCQYLTFYLQFVINGVNEIQPHMPLFTKVVPERGNTYHATLIPIAKGFWGNWYKARGAHA